MTKVQPPVWWKYSWSKNTEMTSKSCSLVLGATAGAKPLVLCALQASVGLTAMPVQRWVGVLRAIWESSRRILGEHGTLGVHHNHKHTCTTGHNQHRDMKTRDLGKLQRLTKGKGLKKEDFERLQWTKRILLMYFGFPEHSACVWFLAFLLPSIGLSHEHDSRDEREYVRFVRNSPLMVNLSSI